MNPRVAWLALYVLVNVVAALIMYNTGELIGDLSGIQLYSINALFWATCLVVASYLVVMGMFFNFISRIKVRKFEFGVNNDVLGRRIGIFLLVAQVLYMLFNSVTGVNIAGSNNVRSTSLLGTIWVFVPADMLFMIYYGLFRSDKYFYPNLVIWIVSNLLRGWAGIFMTVLFLEWCRQVRGSQLSLFRVGLIGLIILFAYPLLTNLKWVIRASSSEGLSIDSIVEVFSMLSFEPSDYWELIIFGINHIIGRLQSVSYIVDVMQLSNFLQTKFEERDFVPFWMEGLHGIAYERLFYGERPTYIGVAFTGYENFNWAYEIGDWNASLGYVSWLFIAPYLTPIYISYTLLLGYASFWLLKKIGATELSKDMLWYAWLTYLMAPWFATFIAFIYALFVFLVIKIIVSKIPVVQPIASSKR